MLFDQEAQQAVPADSPTPGTYGGLAASPDPAAVQALAASTDPSPSPEFTIDDAASAQDAAEAQQQLSTDEDTTLENDIGDSTDTTEEQQAAEGADSTSEQAVAEQPAAQQAPADQQPAADQTTEAQQQDADKQTSAADDAAAPVEGAGTPEQADSSTPAIPVVDEGVIQVDTSGRADDNRSRAAQLSQVTGDYSGPADSSATGTTEPSTSAPQGTGSWSGAQTAGVAVGVIVAAGIAGVAVMQYRRRRVPRARYGNYSSEVEMRGLI